MSAPRPGLCGSCRHARIVESDRGSRFWLCGLAKRDPRFRRYPRLPVRECVGYEPERDGGAGDGGADDGNGRRRREDDR